MMWTNRRCNILLLLVLVSISNLCGGFPIQIQRYTPGQSGKRNVSRGENQTDGGDFSTATGSRSSDKDVYKTPGGSKQSFSDSAKQMNVVKDFQPSWTFNSKSKEGQNLQQAVDDAKSAAELAEQKKHRLVYTLFVITGMAEAIFYRKFGCFPNMMTGNTVRFMDFLAALQFKEAFKCASMIFCYVGGAFTFSSITCFRKKKEEGTSNANKPGRAALFDVSKLSLLVFALSDLVGAKWKSAGQLQLMALGFGMLNSATQVETGAVTNAITGHWTKVGLGFAERVWTSQANKAWMLSVRSAGIFLASLVTTSAVSELLVKFHPTLLIRMPPVGLSVGLLYYFAVNKYVKSAAAIEQP